MSSKPSDRPASKLRQSFLPFTSIPRHEAVSNRENVSDQPKIPRSAPQMPVELWCPILQSQSTIVLKAFRLVCRHWAQVGAEPLFNTVYVDNYEQSWKRLQELSLSQYAVHVQKICWIPLILTDDAWDGDVWRVRYSNTLHGLDNLDCAKLYKSYHRCVNTARALLPAQCPSTIDIDFSRLPNMRELVLEDDIDTESRCEDAGYRRNVQFAASMHESVAMWGFYPRMWNTAIDTWDHIHKHSRYRLFTAAFFLLRNCLTLSNCNVHLWVQNWSFIADLPFEQRSGSDAFTHPSIKTMEMTFKFCDVRCSSAGHHDIWGVEFRSHKAFQCMQNFPNLENLIIRPCFTDPGPQYRAILKQEKQTLAEERVLMEEQILAKEQMLAEGHIVAEEEMPEDDIGRPWLCSQFVLGLSCSHLNKDPIAELDRRYDDVPIMLRNYINSLRAAFHPSLAVLPKLKTLTLHDTTLDMKSLIAWLCGQDQHNVRDLTVFLKGSLVLHGLNMHLFQQLMSWFEVNVICDQSVMCYEIDDPPDLPITTRDGLLPRISAPRPYFSSNTNWQYLIRIPGNRRVLLEVLVGSTSAQIEELVRENVPFTMWQGEPTTQLLVDLTHHPRWIEQHTPHELPTDGWEYYYCMRIHPEGRVEFYWTNVLQSFKHLLGQGKLHVLLVATLHTICDGYCGLHD